MAAAPKTKRTTPVRPAKGKAKRKPKAKPRPVRSERAAYEQSKGYKALQVRIRKERARQERENKPKPRPRSKPKPKPKPKPRVNWLKRKAPREGSRSRAAYERSQVYHERQGRSRKGRETRLAIERARQTLRELRTQAEAEARAEVIDDAVQDFHDAKDTLLDSVDGDEARFLEILDKLTEEEAPDWQIAYASDAAA